MGQGGYLKLVAGDPKCETCAQMWRLYAAATFEHIGVNTKLRLASRSLDQEAIDILKLKVAAAAALRATVRDAIRKHESETHARILV
jgi:hypothetical protein